MRPSTFPASVIPTCALVVLALTTAAAAGCWEYRPGSTIFVVWQQGREEYLEGLGSFRFGQDFGHVFSAPACNTFLVKFAYWFNY